MPRPPASSRTCFLSPGSAGSPAGEIIGGWGRERRVTCAQVNGRCDVDGRRERADEGLAVAVMGYYCLCGRAVAPRRKGDATRTLGCGGSCRRPLLGFQTAGRDPWDVESAEECSE